MITDRAKQLIQKIASLTEMPARDVLLAFADLGMCTHDEANLAANWIDEPSNKKEGE